MIFGFNTDVRHADTVYHVQSEARASDLLLQTQVFVRGRCVGQQTTSYADQMVQPDFSEQRIHELLKAQHRSMVEAVRARRIESIFASPAAVRDAGGGTLGLEWLNRGAAYFQGVLRMRFRVTYQGKPARGARLTSRLALSHEAPVHSEATTGPEGEAEIDVRVDHPAQRECAILVQATHADKSASRKFRLKKAGN